MPGPAPGTGCLVCESPAAPMINAALAQGTLSSRAIARQFQIPKDSVARHAFKRHPGYIAPGSPQVKDPDQDTDKSELVRLKEVRGILEVELARAPRADLSRELRQTNQRIAEIEGTNVVKAATVEDVEGLPEQIAAWFRALEPFPDAREAMFLVTDPKLLEKAMVTSTKEDESE